jgi:tRNA/tmRNA/rRNA uracil-C5-methylase (TrmA/RlmC/RlmD family)
VREVVLAVPAAVCCVSRVGLKKKFNDQPFPYHAEIELEISTLTNLGSGLGRVDLPGSQLSAPDSLLTQPRSGWVVMVPFTLPGERVRARVFRNHKNFSEADLVAVLTPSPHRVAPACPLFARCGGCQYQHLAYAEQLAWKQRQVAELLRHMAGLADFPVAPVVPSPRELGYRSKITPHFNPPRAARGGEHRRPGEELRAESGEPDTENRGPSAERMARERAAHSPSAPPVARLSAVNSQLSAPAAPPPIGFLRQGTRFDVVDVPRCPIATDAINEKLPEVRARVHARAAAGEIVRGATLLLRDASGVVTTDYDAIITETIAQPASETGRGSEGRGSLASDAAAAAPDDGTAHRAPPPANSDLQLSTSPLQLAASAAAAPLTLRFLARDFFQNNPFILPAFTAYVRAQAAASGARFLVDAYCGSGLFALSAASAFERVAGIELSESSVRFARANAAANAIANATFTAGDAAQIFAGLPALATPETPDAFAPAATAVVIDPPRKGCDENFLRQLFAYAPRAVVYVSCDPATQMRDLRTFLAAGYTLTAAQPFDLFPQTRHLECVLTLVRTNIAV